MRTHHSHRLWAGTFRPVGVTARAANRKLCAIQKAEAPKALCSNQSCNLSLY